MSKTLLDNFFEYGIDSRRRILTCFGEVDQKLANRVIKRLVFLDLNSDQPIKMLINSSGGEEIAGMAIYDAVQSCRSHITGIVNGEASSMASIILQACDDRVMAPNSVMLVHNGTIEAYNEYTNALRWVEYMKDFTTNMEDIYLEKIREKHPYYKRKTLKELIRHDTYLTAEKAVKLGLASEVMK